MNYEVDQDNERPALYDPALDKVLAHSEWDAEQGKHVIVWPS
jgi:hypothetical protein